MRVSILRKQVTEFMSAFGQFRPARMVPMAPPADVVRLRARLVAEETFELLASLFPLSDWQSVADDVMARVNVARIEVDMPAFADACGDLDYVVEGARISFGIRGETLADAIHAANMAKVGGPVDAHGKMLKPADWKAPDIEGLLRDQGWAK